MRRMLGRVNLYLITADVPCLLNHHCMLSPLANSTPQPSLEISLCSLHYHLNINIQSLMARRLLSSLVPRRELIITITISSWRWRSEEILVRNSASHVCIWRLTENGNNNDLPSFAKANYFPYGIDFNGGPTGRFSNGYTMVDEIDLSLS